MFGASSKRARISTSTATCLPRWAASASAWTIGESLLVRQIVSLIANTAGSTAADSRKRSTEVSKLW